MKQLEEPGNGKQAVSWDLWQFLGWHWDSRKAAPCSWPFSPRIIQAGSTHALVLKSHKPQLGLPAFSPKRRSYPICFLVTHQVSTCISCILVAWHHWHIIACTLCLLLAWASGPLRSLLCIIHQLQHPRHCALTQP